MALCGRWLATGALLFGSLACSSILGIQDPVARDDGSGLTGGDAGSSSGASFGGSRGGGDAGGAGNVSGSSGGSGSSVGGAKGGSSGTSAGGASAGASGSSAGGATAGSAGAPCVVSGPASESKQNSHVQSSAYYEANDFHGYAFAYADTLGSTIAPDSCSTASSAFTNLAAGSALCAKGNVVAGGYAGIGINANQTVVADPVAITPKGTGLSITVTGAATLAGEILFAKVTDAAEQGYCAPLPQSGVATLPWASFKTNTCGGGSTGTAFSPDLGLIDVQVLVEGVNGASSAYDFCVDNLEETAALGGVQAGGYFYSGELHGYTYVFSSGDQTLGTQITPANFMNASNDGQLCVNGTVAKDPTFASTAGIGVNLNQSAIGSVPAQSLIPTGTGLSVTLTNPGGSPLRVQLNAGSSGTTYYCANVSVPTTGSKSFTLPWSAFTTDCFDVPPTGAAFQPSVGVTSVSFAVPGSSSAGTPFNFCVTAVSE
ncbi:MAG TPA: hypothetical protein VHV51_13550 [Polyangiaceae bacterium]|jgi:hypothetical protein|nr:hypothetical protein [Polyangiaceae bacterium]